MDLRSAPAAIEKDSPPSEANLRVQRGLLGDEGGGLSFPRVGQVAHALVSLARGQQRKVLLPLAEGPFEIALVRHGGDVACSYYSTESMPDVAVLNRRVPLSEAMHLVATSLRLTSGERSGLVDQRLAELVERTTIQAVSGASRSERSGGELGPPPSAALAFGFRAAFPLTDAPMQGTAAALSDRADIHALLFEGHLWGYARGRRIELARGPILLPVQRMVAAVRAVLEAHEAARPAHVRRRYRDFTIALRLAAGASETQASITLAGGTDTVTVTSLDLQQAALPILGLASELLRSLTSADRSQTRNLRVRALREEVRRLRRILRRPLHGDGFTNHDPDRLRPLRPDAAAPQTEQSQTTSATPRRLRFSERWKVEVDELDAGSTFLCGDRIVVSTPRHTVAICRDRGAALWVREGSGGASWMVGTTLLRQAADGHLELCRVQDGETFATVPLARTAGRPPRALHVGGTDLPPAAVVTEGSNRLVALDLRTGEPRWRFACSEGPIEVRRAGSVLLVTSADGAINALSTATGEIAWRYCDRARFTSRPAVVLETVIGIVGGHGGSPSHAVALDLYSGELKWRQPLDRPASTPIALADTVAIATRGRESRLVALSISDGRVEWDVPDGGLARGGAAMPVDRNLIVNAPRGQVTCFDQQDGSVRWRENLSEGVADEVPRCLEPVLRGGALFVPASSVHVLRPNDGERIGGPLPVELVPDLLRIDERGWVYIAEESGVVTAFSPVAHLSLVR